MQPDEIKTEQLKTPISATEILFLLGLVFLFFGLWVWLGIGIAMTAVGINLIVVALINSWMRYMLEARDVV